MPHETLKHELVDVICIGENELTMKEVAERIEEEGSLTFSSEGRVRC